MIRYPGLNKSSRGRRGARGSRDAPGLRRLLCLFLLGAGLGGLQATAASVDFDAEIRPVLSQNCFKCHGPDAAARKSGLRLDQRSEAIKPGKSGRTPIVPGQPDQSELIARIGSADSRRHMPPPASNLKLSPDEATRLRRWVAEGAPYAPHWAYQAPVRPPLPPVKNSSWARNPVDRFILARLEREKLQPTAPAQGYHLARRVALALTGLPPNAEQLETFLRDPSPAAYEHLVDQLLASPAYGEHWARLWLDLARYADSTGYADDPLRTIWGYRDYVIRAFNANKPFDRFTIEQIAGDLLQDAGDDELVATAFHRNTMTNNEGGTDDEEFRNVAVVDRVNTTFSVWMATSIACAQCHDHKYDPISQKEYFATFAIFNNTEDADRRDEAPVLRIADSSLKEPKQPLTTNNSTTVPIMRELTGDKRRQTRLQLRGNFKALGDPVSEGLPAVFPPLPAGEATNRLALGRWLVDGKNPLTARVIANRYWEQLFGVGIVRTCEDFGTQGDRPTHPELLDWLATELVAKHWDLKAFLKLLVTSATYCQSSRVTTEGLERDPENLLLARGPRFRMSAEEVRDQALKVSGLLSGKMFGPSVRPPQPALGLSAAFGGSLDWKNSQGEDRYRRAVYIEWRRTSPYPSMTTFDAPNREVCALRRPRSNTPLQALVTLNDPVYVEAAQALGKRMFQVKGTLAEQVSYGFQLCLCRQPKPEELHRLVTFYGATLNHFVEAPSEAKLMAAGESTEASAAEHWPELAACTAVGNVLLNLDETLMPP